MSDVALTVVRTPMVLVVPPASPSVLAVGVQGPKGADGPAVELDNDGTHVRWRVAGSGGAWTNLIALADIEGGDGSDGREIEVGTTGTHIVWRYVGDAAWTNLVALSVLRGNDGREVELGADESSIMWRYTGDSWTVLVALSSLRGADGPNTVSTATTTNIAGLLKGDAGLVAQATAGTDYFAPVDGTLRVGDGLVSAPSLSFTSDPDTGWYSGGSDVLKAATGGTDRMAITDNGVGINTAIPSTGSLLTVAKTLADGEQVMVDVTPGNLSYGVKMGVVKLAGYMYPGLWLGQATPSVTNYAMLLSAGTIFNSPAGQSIYFRIGNVNQFTVSSAGKSGFGTIGPAAKVHVLSTTEQLRIGYDASNYASMTVGPTGGITFSNAGSATDPWTFSGNVVMNGPANRMPNQTAATADSVMTRQLVDTRLAMDSACDLVFTSANAANKTVASSGVSSVLSCALLAGSGTTAGGAAMAWYYGSGYNTPFKARGMGYALDWSKRWRMSMTLLPIRARGTSESWFWLGISNVTTVPFAPSAKGLGWRLTGTQLVGATHNGTTAAYGSVAFTVTEGSGLDVLLDYDGIGTLRLYVNDALIDAVAGGPTGLASTNYGNMGVGAYSAAGGSANEASVDVGNFKYKAG